MLRTVPRLLGFRLQARASVQSRTFSAFTNDDIMRALGAIGNRIESLETKVTLGLADVRALIGQVHETALRGELRIQRGSAFAESFFVANTLSLVRLAAPAGQLLPSENALQFADRGERTADVSYLETDRAVRLVAAFYVRGLPVCLAGCRTCVIDVSRCRTSGLGSRLQYGCWMHS